MKAIDWFAVEWSKFMHLRRLGRTNWEVNPVWKALVEVNESTFST